MLIEINSKCHINEKKLSQSVTTLLKKLLTGIEPVTSTLPMLRTTDCAIAATAVSLTTP